MTLNFIKKIIYGMKNCKLYIYIFIMLLGVIGILYSYDLYHIGFHNVDLGFNYHYLEGLLGMEFVDTASDFNQYSYIELYIIGHNQIKNSFYYMMISVFVFVCSLNELCCLAIKVKK